MNKVALIVGIDDYKYDPLKFCVSDAKAISEILQRKEYGFESITLFNGKATKKEILRNIEKLKTQKPKVLLFFFAGHGIKKDEGTFLVTYDGTDFDEGVDVDRLAKAFASFESSTKTIFSILDCCHSGAAKLWNSSVRNASTADFDPIMHGLSENKVLIAACTKEQSSYEDPNFQHGKFTQKLIEAINGEAADHEGVISANSIYDYIASKFIDDEDQKPVFKTEITSRITLGGGFKPKSSPPTEEEILKRVEDNSFQTIENFLNKTRFEHSIYKESGFKYSCQTLEPIIKYIKKNAEQYPELKGRTKFVQAESSAYARLKQLGVVEQGIVTSKGRIEGEIGAGAFGSVWKLSDSKSNKFAYKIYHPAELNLVDKIQRFKRGYEAMKQLDHPHIVKVYEYTECPAGFYMDFIDGSNLRKFGNGFSNELQRLFLLSGVAQTISHAHDRKIVHRDIKPENIIVVYDTLRDLWVPHLTDFDLAWFSTATMVTKEAMGTVNYAAPEQLNAPTSFSSKQNTVDVYSFAQVMFYLITNADPSPSNIDQNEKVLGNSLKDLGSYGLADKYFKLYHDCSIGAYQKRLDNFKEIEERITLMIQEERLGETRENIAANLFLVELIYSIVGYEKKSDVSICEFTSLSGRTNVMFTLKNVTGDKISIEAIFYLNTGLQIAGKSNQEAREKINNSVDSELRPFHDKVIRKGNSGGTFSVCIEFKSISSNKLGLAYSRNVILRVLSAVEK